MRTNLPAAHTLTFKENHQMLEYKYHLATAVYAGRDVVINRSAAMKKLGERAFIITTKFPDGIENKALKDCIEACRMEGIECKVTEEAIPNPTIASVHAISLEAIDFKPDFFIGCGGGSAIDTAKGCAILYDHPGEDPFEVFYDGEMDFKWNYGLGEAKCPIVAVPTTAGTGSEVGQVAVLTNERRHTKQSIKQRTFPAIAYLDSQYVKTAPDLLLDASAMDALAHGVEAYLNTSATHITKGYAMAGFDLFSKYKDALLAKTMTDEDYDNLTLASNIFGMGMIYRTTITHGMGYPLTEEKGLSHGLACAVFLGEFLRNLHDKTLAEPVYKTCGFDTVDAFADYVNQLLEPYIDFTVTEEEIDRWTEQMYAAKWRLELHPEEITPEDIKKIYVDSLMK